MDLRRCFVGGCLLAAALTMSGCGGGGGPAETTTVTTTTTTTNTTTTTTTSNTTTTTTSPNKTTVLVMRHCLRSVEEDAVFDLPGFPYFDNYTARPWPKFPVPPMFCLPRGERLVEASGGWLREHGELPLPVDALVDECERDNVTARAFLRGLGVGPDDSSFTIDPRPFHAKASADCPRMSSSGIAAAVGDRAKAYPAPEKQLLATLYRVMGVGAAGNWTGSACAPNATSGYLDGSCAAASDFAERLMFEWGGNMTIGWGELGPDDVLPLLRLRSWYRQVNNAVPAVVASGQASIARAVLAALETGKGGTTLFTGHDTQQNALNGALGIAWDPSPFPVNDTMPGSMLRFDRIGDTVHASYVFMTNYSDDSGAMTSVPVDFLGSAGADGGSVTLADFRARVEAGSIAACANSVFAGAQDEPGDYAATLVV